MDSKSACFNNRNERVMNKTKKTYGGGGGDTDLSAARKRHTMGAIKRKHDSIGPNSNGLAAQTSRPCPALKNKNYHSVNSLHVNR